MQGANESDDVHDGRNRHVRSGLEDYERSGEGRPPWMLTVAEMKLLGIAGVGFFLDGMQLLFIRNFHCGDSDTISQRTICSLST